MISDFDNWKSRKTRGNYSSSDCGSKLTTRSLFVLEYLWVISRYRVPRLIHYSYDRSSAIPRRSADPFFFLVDEKMRMSATQPCAVPTDRPTADVT